MPLILALAALVISPFERINNDRYVARAKEKLRRNRSIKIAITGSYGKTSVKNALYAFLSEEFSTRTTPANYNTPLGIAKSVENLQETDTIFIAEMGARRIGDIRELCELVSPDLGVITGIAPQHLETFGSIENILAEKNVLASYVPENGIVFYNVADERVRTLSDCRKGGRVTVGYENADYLIGELHYDAKGTTFSLSHGDRKLAIKTPLLGKSAAENLSLAAAVALHFGVEEQKILAAAYKMTPVPHRLQAIDRGGVLIIDDSYNVNPIGASVALETLSHIEGKRKIVYTCGMVELGKQEKSLNEEFGKEIARVADISILQIGRYGDSIARGLSAMGYSGRVYRVRDTEEATALFAHVLSSGDVLLITSDLPREYCL